MTATYTNNHAQVERVYRDYKDPVYNYVFRLSGDPDQAQDVTQHTFLKIITDPGFDKVENIKSYLFTIARNHLYDTWKKKKETLADDTGLDIAASASEGELTEELAEQQRQQAVVFCVQRLADKYRELMILRYIEDLSIKEIALITLRSQSDIKVSLLRARQQFDKGLTQHMYLKIAKSRQQCGEMKTMLAPYPESEIPSDKLPLFEEHIDKCSICAEDAEEQKRTRKLLAIIPPASAPLSLDTSFNDAMAASSSPATTPIPDTNITSNALLVKAAASVAVVVLIVGGVLLIPEKENNTLPAESPKLTQPKQPSKPIAAPPTQAATQPATGGSATVTAKAYLTSGSPPTKAQWTIYQVGSTRNSNDKFISGVNSKELNKALAPGEYKIKARIGAAEVERKILLEKGKPLSLDMVINAGNINISTRLANTINLHSSQLNYLIFKSRKDLESHQVFVAKTFQPPVTKFTLAAGEYFLKARYTGFGKIETVKNFSVLPGKTIDIQIPVEVGYFKPEAILSSKNLSHIRNVSWSMQKKPIKDNQPTSFRTIANGKEEPMAPGNYVFTVKLENIEQQTRATIKSGELTAHKIILRGGIVKSAAWLDNSKNKRDTSIYLQIYNFEKYKRINEKGIYVQPLATFQNNITNNSIILPEGKYAIVAKNNTGHKIRATRHFTVEDGDTKHIELLVQK